MVKKYARLLEQRQINDKTGETWAIQDVPATWRDSTKIKVEEDGYEFLEDGTAQWVPVPPNEEEK